jgi:DSF synthase
MALTSVLALDRQVERKQASYPQRVQFPHTPHLDIQHDHTHATLWIRLKPSAPPCFTPDLLNDLDRISQTLASGAPAVRYQVLASQIPEVFSLGGDLTLFRELVLNGDRDGLIDYAHRTVDLVYSNSRGHGRPITTISLVQGIALGGGFETALSGHVLIAERGTRFGFPEVLFNLFPGMGAYTLLRRRVPESVAERIIMEGNTLLAEDLHDLGIVDFLAEPGEGERVVRYYIERSQSRARGHSAFRRALSTAAPVCRDELMRVVNVWVDAAMELTGRDLKVMEFLVRSQSKYSGQQLAAISS